MKETTMLDPEALDLADLANALDDRSLETAWWFDPRTGDCEPWPTYPDYGEDSEEGPDERGLIPVEPLPSGVGYGDMEDFVAQVRDPRARGLLSRAIEGRGAFRRFKDTLYEFPDLREAWFAFHDARMERRAISWLADEGLIDAGAAERAAAGRPDPDLPALGHPLDPDDVAAAVAAGLRELYGPRLEAVLLFGSWARGDGHPESDIDLLVCLTGPVDPWRELRRMDAVLWEHSFANDTVVTALAVDAKDLERQLTPLLRRVHAEGRRVA
jgi:predicted nucleotidyltransferase